MVIARDQQASSTPGGVRTQAGASAVTAAIQETIALQRVTARGTVQSVDRDTTGRQLTATVRLGDQDAVVVLDGRPVREGEAIEISRSLGAAVHADWRFERYADGLSPYPVIDADATIPAPTWLSTPLSTSVSPAGPGGQLAIVTARLRETPERFLPQYTEIQYATDAQAAAGTWASLLQGNRLGQDADLEIVIPGLPMGVGLNVRARTVTVSGARSDWGDLRTITTATDGTAPSLPGLFVVDVSASFTALITFPQPSLPLVFSHWDVSIATSAGGVNATTYQARGSQYMHQDSPGDIYVRIREVTRSGVAGPWSPAGGWDGPYTIRSDGGVGDTTPPPAPVLSSVTATVELIQGVTAVVVTTSLAAYAPPSDWSHFELRHTVTEGGTNYYEFWRTTALVHRRYDARQGVSITVEARSLDHIGNGSAWSAPITVSSPTIQVPPTPGAAPTLTSYFKGIVLEWAPTADSATTGRIVSYEIQRAPNSGGLPGTWATIANVTATRWVDAALGVATTYHYRYRPINASGVPAAGYSPSASATTLAVENGDIAANAITANKLAATIVLATEIRAENPGKITAGNGKILLDELGVTVNGTGALRFTNEAQFDYTPMRQGANQRAAIDVVENWRGYPGRGLRLYPRATGELDEPGVYIEGQQAATVGFHAAKITGRRLRFLSDDGAPAAGWEYNNAGIVRDDASLGQTVTWVVLANDGAWATASAGVDVLKTLAAINVPAGATGVFLRYTFTASTSVRVYIHGGGGNAPEFGLYARGMTNEVTMAGWVPVNAGASGIYLRSTGGTVTGILWVYGYSR